jgi:hypothetical protein
MVPSWKGFVRKDSALEQTLLYGGVSVTQCRYSWELLRMDYQESVTVYVLNRSGIR